MKRRAKRTQKLAPRYAGSEIGVVRKNWKDRIRVALVYPNTYRVGMSNLGFQSVYTLFNAHAGVVCERAFLPDSQEGPSLGVRTLESGKSLPDFEVSGHLSPANPCRISI